jgi:hypothetical protein
MFIEPLGEEWFHHNAPPSTTVIPSPAMSSTDSFFGAAEFRAIDASWQGVLTKSIAVPNITHVSTRAESLMSLGVGPGALMSLYDTADLEVKIRSAGNTCIKNKDTRATLP